MSGPAFPTPLPCCQKPCGRPPQRCAARVAACSAQGWPAWRWAQGAHCGERWTALLLRMRRLSSGWRAAGAVRDGVAREVAG